MRLGTLAALCLLLSVSAAVAETAPHHEITLQLDPQSRAITVEDRFDLAARGDFDLAPWVGKISASIDGQAVEVSRQGHRVRLLSAGDATGPVTVTLEGTVPALPPPEARRGWPGAAAGDVGSVLSAGSGWLPVAGDERITYRLTVEVPEPHRAVATGRLVEETLTDGRYRATFESEAVGEPPSVFIGPYTVTERREGDLRLRTYFHEDLVPLADDYLEQANSYIARYSDLIGDYPYADFHIISSPFGVGLGFVNLTYVGRRVLPLPFMRGRSLAHEILHNWWGNGVGIDYATGNWAEGLTSYMADYALARDRGAAAREMRLGWLQNYAALPAERDRPIRSFVSKRHDASQVIGYDKTAFTFLMLERELGEAAFRDGLRRFWQSHRFTVAGWDDLRRAFEETADTELGWFFDQWIARTGAPRIALDNVTRRGKTVSFALSQSGPPYRLRLPVLFETAAGPQRHEVVLESASQQFELPVERGAQSIRIDPDLEVFRRLLPGESPPIFRDITLSEEAIAILATQGTEFEEMAASLASRLLQRPVTLVTGGNAPSSSEAVVAIGLDDDIADLRAKSGPFSQDQDLADGFGQQGTVRAWAERRLDGTARGTPWLFVSARDAESLAAALRPLPHYRSRSYVVFDGRRAIQRGHWPVRASPLSRDLTGE